MLDYTAVLARGPLGREVVRRSLRWCWRGCHHQEPLLRQRCLLKTELNSISAQSLVLPAVVPECRQPRASPAQSARRGPPSPLPSQSDAAAPQVEDLFARACVESLSVKEIASLAREESLSLKESASHAREEFPGVVRFHQKNIKKNVVSPPVTTKK